MVTKPVVAIANQKGGVGKTTLALQCVFQAIRDKKKVLLVDFDPQGNSSSRLIHQSDPSGKVRTSQLYRNPKRWSLRYENIFASEAGADVIYAAKNDQELYAVDQSSLNRLVYPVAHIDGIINKYDLVVLDCPPTLGRNLLAALCCATHVVSPVEVSGFAVDGLEGLFSTFKEVQTTINPNLKVCGVVINKFNPRSADQVEASRQLRQILGELLFQSVVRYRTAIDAVNIEGQPIWKRQDRLATREMKALFNELMERINI